MKASEMTVEHMGQHADDGDLEVFRALVAELAERDHLDEQYATDLLWNGGDYIEQAYALALMVPDDDPCLECGAHPARRQCDRCNVAAHITDCGHQEQPRPITAGRADGTEMHETYCFRCAGGAR